MISIVIPARHELYLKQTVDDLFAKAAGEIEVIVVLDDCWVDPPLPERKNLHVLHWGRRRGMRAGINAAAVIGKGNFLMKVDAHCMFGEGFDILLRENCDSDWLVVPRRYALDADAWAIKDKTPVDYEYLSYPFIDENSQLGLHGKVWGSRAVDRRAEMLDENMSFQGSCWFMPMRYFKDLIYPMDEANYGLFIGEPQEIGLKVWLGGGKIMTNKLTWYAHLWKGQGYREKFMAKYGFGYTRVGKQERARGNAYSLDHWFFNRWPERKHDLTWLVDRFWPVPSWPESRDEWTRLPSC